jgi:cell division protein FtsZ
MNETTSIPCDGNTKLSNMIKIIGTGDGGSNIVENMYEKGVAGVDFIICNTDPQALNNNHVPTKIRIEKQHACGLGAGCNPDKGHQTALENLDEIKNALSINAKMAFIIAGLGGDTGTGTAPLIAKEAKDMGIFTLAIVTLPFQDEGEEPYCRAVDGLLKLRQHVDSILIVNNQRMYDIYPNLSVFDAFPKIDNIVAAAVKSIAELITVKGYINMDFADIKTFMTNDGAMLTGLGKAKGENRAQKAIQQALESPLLDGNNIYDADKICIIISTSDKNPLKMSELAEVGNYINVNSDTKVFKNVTNDVSLDDEIAITIIATGFSLNKLVPIN